MSEISNLITAVERGDVDAARQILARSPELANQRDDSGATAMHCATFNGQREMVDLLLEFGADINAADSKYGATPTGWAIEHLRERGGFLGIELSDLAYAIDHGHVEWVQRFLTRFPRLKQAMSTEGVSFRQLARGTGNPEIMKLFDDPPHH